MKVPQKVVSGMSFALLACSIVCMGVAQTALGGQSPIDIRSENAVEALLPPPAGAGSLTMTGMNCQIACYWS